MREGNRFALVDASGGGDGLDALSNGGATVTWLRSAEPHPAFAALHATLREHGHPAGLPLHPHPALAAPTPGDEVDGGVVAVAEPPAVMLPVEGSSGGAAAAVAFVPVTRRRRASEVLVLPATPGLHVVHDADPASSYAAAVAAAAESRPHGDAATNAARDDSPLFTSAAALRLLRNEAVIAAADPLQYHATVGDVGHYLAARITWPAGRHSQAKGHHVTRVVGPIEAAPPRIRELGIEGEAVVGATLRAQCVYYGGSSGVCLFSWVRVDVEGNRTESEPLPARPAPAPRHAAAIPTAAVEGAAAAAVTTTEGAVVATVGTVAGAVADPRELRITAEDVGCQFKVSVQPVRWDGVRGEPSTSKPTAEVSLTAVEGGAAPSTH